MYPIPPPPLPPSSKHQPPLHPYTHTVQTEEENDRLDVWNGRVVFHLQTPVRKTGHCRSNAAETQFTKTAASVGLLSGKESQKGSESLGI